MPSGGPEVFLADLLFILPSSAEMLLQLTRRFSLFLSLFTGPDHGLQRNPPGAMVTKPNFVTRQAIPSVQAIPFLFLYLPS